MKQPETKELPMRAEMSRIRNIRNYKRAEDLQEEEMIQVSAATKRVAFAYERFRNTLEPDEEDILRRRAIFRILVRRLLEDKPAEILAEQLLQELIRANYISPVPRSLAQHIGKRLDRAKIIRDGLNSSLEEWFLNIVAVSIDRDIFPRRQEEAFVQLMYQDSSRRTEWVDDLVSPKEQPTQLYIGCHRALFEADDYEISWHYFINHFPAWNAVETADSDLATLRKNLTQFYSHIRHATQHPSRGRIARILRPVAVSYRITRDVLGGEEADISSLQDVERLTREAIEKRTRRVRSRMNRRAWNSILFLFFTKTIVAFLLEVPYEAYLLGEVHLPSLAINILFHPIILFFAATSARLPGARNADMIVDQVHKIVSGSGQLPTIVMRRTRSYGALTWALFALIYVVLFLFLFWGVFSVLALLKFSLVAMFMFLMFLGLVTFLAARIRRSVVEVRVIPRREGALGATIGFLSLPAIEFGRWLALNVSKVNVPLILMDRVLEAPFKIFIDIMEEWFSFVRDRREEIV